MYTTFFGLRELPFSHTNDLRFFFPTPATRTVEERLKAALHEHSGLMLFTGDPGTGKTTLLRRILSSLENNIRAISLPFSAARFDDVLSYLCSHLGVERYGHDPLTKVLAIQEHLKALGQQGYTTVLCIDEAQHLLKETLDRLRLLLHLRGPTGKLLQILLVGQPWLEAKLAHSDLRHLQQYVTAHCRLDPLTPDAVPAFIEHRLRVAGCTHHSLFSPESIQRIAHYSQAVPQLINVICDNSLLTAYMAGSHTVTHAFVEEVAENLKLSSYDPLSADNQVQPSPINEQTPVMIRPFTKRTSSLSQSWAPHMAWASVGVFCAWLSSSPSSPVRVPFVAPGSHPVGLSSPLVRTPALVATPLVAPRTQTVQSTESGPTIPLLQEQQLPPPQHIAQEQQPSVTQLPPHLFMAQNPPPLSEPSPESVPTPKDVPSPTLTSATDLAQTLAPASPAPHSQTEDRQSTPKVPEATSLSLVLPKTATEVQLAPVPPKERNQIGNPQAQTVSTPRAKADAKATSLQPTTPLPHEVLFRATRIGNVREVERFLKARGPVDAKDARGWTALMIAAHDNRLEIVHVLLAHGAAVNTTNKEGETALIYAADNNHLAIVQMLLKHGAAIDKKSKLGWTALMYAAAKGHRLTVEALLDKGADPNVRDNDGQTAASYALRQGTVSSLGEQLRSPSSFRTRFDRVDAEKDEWLKRHEYREITSMLRQAERK